MKSNTPGCACPLATVISFALLWSGVRAAEPDTTLGERVPVEVFQAAHVVSGPGECAYPEGQSGWVVLDMMISPQGRAYEVGVLESVGDPRLEAAAVKAMSRVRFEPARSDGTPVDSSLTVKISPQAPVCPSAHLEALSRDEIRGLRQRAEHVEGPETGSPERSAQAAATEHR